MSRQITSEYFLAVYGIRLSPATLAKKAVTGGGPPFQKDGRFPIYNRKSNDAYALERLGPLRTSTSDKGQQLAA